MMKSSGVQKKLIVAAMLLVFMAVAPSIVALPMYQGFPCFGAEGCPEPVNPEPDEYYSIQCTTNAIWVWRTMPNLMLVTGIPLLQVNALSDGGSFIGTFEVMVTRNGDTITLSGTNGNLAPQPGEKSFSWNECIERNGGLPELPFDLETLTDEQRACLTLPTEQEKVSCLNALGSDSDASNPQTCEDPNYLATHAQECIFVSCPLDPSIRVADLSDCPDQLEQLYRFFNALLDFCLGPPVQAGVGIVTVAVFRTRRKRK
jgi:hypothetical protein